MIGKRVKVMVYRPLGSKHPKFSEILYPINYGFVPNTLAEDGEEIDAYIVGVDFPVEEFIGNVIAVIIRKNDVENKLVVAPDNTSFTKDEIYKQVLFQERFFDFEVLIK